MIDVNALKQKIITFLEEHGPSIPVKIAKEIKQEPVFASALLGELTQAKKVNTSHMRVGSSQIYFLPGQEKKLESFAEEFLGGVVKQAYLQLKEKKYLIDKNQEPRIRVALRSLKDFATAFMHNDEVLWRYNFASNQEISSLLQNVENKNQESKNEPQKQEEITKKPQEKEEQVTLTEQKAEEKIEQKTVFVKKPFTSPIQKKENSEKKENKQEDLKESHKKPKNQHIFTTEVKTFLEKKGLELTEEIEESRNELVGIINTNGDLGETKYLLIARNKKSINDADLRVAKSKSHEKNMPCYLLHKGKLTKSAQTLFEEIKNILKVEALS